jgi:hypothetical protein
MFDAHTHGVITLCLAQLRMDITGDFAQRRGKKKMENLQNLLVYTNWFSKCLGKQFRPHL